MSCAFWWIRWCDHINTRTHTLKFTNHLVYTWVSSVFSNVLLVCAHRWYRSYIQRFSILSHICAYLVYWVNRLFASYYSYFSWLRLINSVHPTTSLHSSISRFGTVELVWAVIWFFLNSQLTNAFHFFFVPLCSVRLSRCVLCVWLFFLSLLFFIPTSFFPLHYFFLLLLFHLFQHFILNI